jgi:hypothetical protein
MEDGIKINLRAPQDWKPLESIRDIDVDNCNCANAEQPWNMLPLTPAEPATTAETNPVQPWKILMPNFVTDEGTTTDFNDVPERNA